LQAEPGRYGIFSTKGNLLSAIPTLCDVVRVTLCDNARNPCHVLRISFENFFVNN